MLSFWLYKVYIAFKEFSFTKQKLSEHWWKMHERLLKLYTCTNCKKTFSSSSKAATHLHQVGARKSKLRIGILWTLGNQDLTSILKNSRPGKLQQKKKKESYYPWGGSFVSQF